MFVEFPDLLLSSINYDQLLIVEQIIVIVFFFDLDDYFIVFLVDNYETIICFYFEAISNILFDQFF